MKTKRKDPVREAEADLFDAAFRLVFDAKNEEFYVAQVKRYAEALLRESFKVRHRRRPRPKAKKAAPKLRAIAGGRA